MSAHASNGTGAADVTDDDRTREHASAVLEEEDEVDQAIADPCVPPDNLRIVSSEPRRMGRRFDFNCHRSVEFLQCACLSLCLFVIILAIVVGYLKTMADEPVVPAPISGSRAESTPRLCDRAGCVLRAAETVLFLNRSVDPCGDFYSYACGGFSEAHPTETMRPIGVRQVLERRNRDRLLTLLREEQYFNTSSSSAIAKARVFFSTCLSSYEHDDNRVMTLVELLDRLGGLELFGTWTIRRRKTRAAVVFPEETQFDFNDVINNASLLYPEQAFFEVRYDSQLNLLELDLPRLAMGFVEAVTRPGTVTHDQLTSRLQIEMIMVLAHLEHDSHGVTKLRSCSNKCAKTMAEDILAVQDALAVLRPDPTEAAESQHGMSLPELSQLVPQIDWRRLLDGRYGEGFVPDTVTIKVPSSDYMAGIGRIIDDTRYQRLYHFLVWPVIRGYLVALGPVYATLSEHLDHEFALKPVKSREQQCFSLLEKHMEPALRGLLLSAHIGEGNLPFVRDLLKEARGPLIDSFTWMSENSRRVSMDFLELINVDFGDAPSITSPLDDYYSPLRFNSVRTGFFHNLKQLYGFTRPVQIIQNPLFGDKPPGSASVRYDVGRKTITVPYGAMQRPWFDADVPPSLNAAALGSYFYEAFSVPFFIDHMMVNQTFDWDEETLSRLDEFINCITEIFQQQPVHQQLLLALGKSTPETTEYHFLNFTTSIPPEVAALFLSRGYFSYHLSRRLYSQLVERGPDVSLPGLSLNSSDQTFYLTFAQARCHNGYLEEEVIHEMGEQSRLPQHIAINSLVHSDSEFRRAFQCEGRRAAEGVYRDIGSCQLLKWPADGDSRTTVPTTAGTDPM